MKIGKLVLSVSLASCSTFADNWNTYGNTTYGSDGSSYTRYGNSVYGR